MIKKMHKILSNILMVAVLSLPLFVVTSCEDIFSPQRDIVLTIDPNLPIDSNGYSYFELYSMDTQNIHTIGGSIRVNGAIPDPEREKVYWQSSHYWKFNAGDTLATLYRRTWRGLGWTTVGDPISVINLTDVLVPTINPVSYSEADGSVHTVIAPMWDMRGDTMTIVLSTSAKLAVAKIILK